MYHAVCLADLVDLRALCGDASPAWLRDAVARAAGFLDERAARRRRHRRCSATAGAARSTSQRLLAQARALEAPLAPRAPERGERHRATRARCRCAAWCARAPTVPTTSSATRTPTCSRSTRASAPCASSPTPAPAPTPTVPCARHLRSTAAHNTVAARRRRAARSVVELPLGTPRPRARAGARRGRALRVARRDARRLRAGSPGSPAPQRLWLVGENEIWVLDAVLGSGRHRIASRLHLHPDATRADASVLRARRRRARGASRRSTNTSTRRARCAQIVAEADASLPWLGGFWLRFGATPARVRHLALDGRVAQLRLDGRARTLAVDWNLDATGAAAVAIR